MKVDTTTKKPEVAVKINNYSIIQNRVMQQLKLLIVFESVLGVNRLYLYDYRKCVRRISSTYNVILVLLALAVFFGGDIIYSTYQMLFNDVMAIEYMLLALCAGMQRRKLKKFLNDLQSFDERLNVQNNIFLIITSQYSCLIIAALLLYNIIENILYLVLNCYTFASLFSIYAACLAYIIRESETVFLCVLLSMVLKRLCFLRAHVAKLFSVKAEMGKNCTHRKKFELSLKDLTRNVVLDVTSLHKVYDSLHKCSEQLNYILAIPMMIMLVATGLSAIMVFKNMILLFQHNEKLHNVPITNVLVAFGAGRCTRSLIFLIFPCYYANTAKHEVNFIRNMIYETLNTKELDKIERRKIKAFFQLTCDKEFAYSLFGLVRLDMSLPLSYLSLCLTYLIIVVQFSKFID